MAATLMQLRRLVRSRLGIPMSDDFMTDSVLDDAINLAMQTIDAENRWPWSEAAQIATISVDNPDIVPPDNWRTTRAVFYGESELAYISPLDMMTWLDDEASSDVPKVWSPLAGVIAVRPTPGAASDLRHYFYVQTPWLRDDDDVPLIPAQYAGAIVAKAAELLATRESSGGDAARHGVEFTAWLTRMRQDVRNVTGPTRTRVRPG